MKLKVAIIDDEKHAIETLTYDLKDIFEDRVEIVFTATNPVEGLKLLKAEQPDLLFLDMDMPRLSGLDVLHLVEDMQIQVIITTAHVEYAVQTVGTKAVVYLLKPVQPEILTETVEKCIGRIETKQKNADTPTKISVPVLDGYVILKCANIIFCKSDNNYTEFVLEGGRKLVASKTLKYFEEILPASEFLRVHKSYIVNTNHILKYFKRDGGEILTTGNYTLPVSRSQREEILKLIQNSF